MSRFPIPIPAVVVIVLAVAGLTVWWVIAEQGSSPTASDNQVCPYAPGPNKPVPPAQPFDSDGAAYAGNGPHPITIIDQASSGDLWHGGVQQDVLVQSSGDESYTWYSLPDTWQAGSEKDVSPIQLVACVYLSAIDDDEDTGGSCLYGNPNDEDGPGTGLTITDATYVVVVHEAKTARTIGTFTMQSPKNTTGCPDARPAGTEETWLSPPKNTDFLNGLRPFVQRH